VPIVSFDPSLGSVVVLLTVLSACANGEPPPSRLGFVELGEGGTGPTPNPEDAGPTSDSSALGAAYGSVEAAAGSSTGADVAASEGLAQSDAAAGSAVCDPSCRGCCDSTQTCVSGSSDTACGQGGGPCQDCNAVGSTCQAGGLCMVVNSGSSSGGVSSSSSGSSGSGGTGGSSGGGCSPASCATGCCQGGTCHSGGSDFHCGTGGATCVDCTTTMQNCLNHQCG
jgi:hypothetical protein